jgi:hypothetical protein
MDEHTIRDVFGWMPPEGGGNFRKITAGGIDYLQIMVAMGAFAAHSCIPLQGRPDMSRPHGHATMLEFLRARLDRHVLENGSDEGFELGEQDVAEVQEEIMDFYRRRRFLLETAAPAKEFAVVISDGQHALQLMDLLEQYSADQQRVRDHRKYEPYIRCHIIQARILQRLDVADYAEIAETVRTGIAELQEFSRNHQAWEYADIDESIYPNALIAYLRKLAVGVLERGQEDAVQQEEYEAAAVIRDLIAEFRTE